jgi:predicted DNA-binding antitoxin AbrB/MazE fold protein
LPSPPRGEGIIEGASHKGEKELNLFRGQAVAVCMSSLKNLYFPSFPLTFLYYFLILQLTLEVINMSKTIEAIYENGVLKPLNTIDLKEHEKVKIVIVKVESTAKATSGIIKGLDDKTIDEIALSPEFLPEEA